jgi:hypothetical protein
VGDLFTEHRQTFRPSVLAADLDLWDKLLVCVPPGSDFIPDGDVEDRLFELFPSTEYDRSILRAKKPGVNERLDLGDQMNLTVSPVLGHD